MSRSFSRVLAQKAVERLHFYRSDLPILELSYWNSQWDSSSIGVVRSLLDPTLSPRVEKDEERMGPQFIPLFVFGGEEPFNAPAFVSFLRKQTHTKTLIDQRTHGRMLSDLEMRLYF